MSTSRVLLGFVILLFCVAPSLSLYEDQVGLADWHQKYIGKVKQAVFHTQKAGRKRVVVSTEENVVASLDLRRGDIYVVTLSSEGGILRAWNLPDGQMVWETFLQGSVHSKSLLSVQASTKMEKDSLILVFGKGFLHGISSIDGDILWRKEFHGESLEIQKIFQPVDSDIVYAVGLVGTSEFHIYQISAKNGDILKHNSAVFPNGFYGEPSFVTNDMLVALDATRSSVILISFTGGDISFHQTYVVDFGQEFSGTATILPSKTVGFFAVKVDSTVLLMRVKGGNKLELAEKIGDPAVISDALFLSDSQQAFVTVQQDESTIHLTVKLDNDLRSGLLKESIKMDHQRGLIQKVFINNYVRTDRSHGFRALVVMEDHSLHLIQQGDIVWSREDGLASIIDMTTSELPVQKDGVSVAKVEHNLFEWLKWQVPHHHALDENPSILVVGRCGADTDAPGIFSIIDSYTGKERKSLRLAHSIAQVIPLPFTDSSEQRLHLIVDTEKRAHLYPRSREALGDFLHEISNIYWYSVKADKGIIRGHSLRGNCFLEVADDYCFDSQELWSIVFPSESEKIAAAVTKKLNEVVHTQAKVSADEDVMYKYISKNMLFVATVAPKASDDIGSVTPEEAWLVAYLIDVVTGRILHRVTHMGAQGPIHAVLSENWVVYHYFNLRAHRYEMSVIEIYDQSRADNKDFWRLVLGKHNLTSPISSYSRPEVAMKSQTYFFTHSVKTMAVTSTAKGITTKQLLIGTIGSQSYVTHSRQVEGLRRIVTIPAKLESTTLVFTYGVDLFFTRIAPSRTYDSLTEDFNYALLLLTIIVLLVAIFVTWVLSERKDLRDKWR
ncbi:hypothetical protein QJS10_CPB18g01096 [Acorus calamus]|uniref:ER membrane protein complex subunit 1 n=1 Tax=Acorus calamus TaxID=4465 RepID=A0AAV9CMP0_ACOCL|nr:hypothetical protein QJS10_CPB18g01096 [Acorus calamus]